MRLPCVVRWPGHIPAGAVSSELATGMDFLPTLAELCDATVPGDRVIDGKSIAPLLRQDQDARSPHEAFFYYRLDDLQAVRSGRWKLHVQRRELYDLETDVGESCNLIEQHPEIAEELDARADLCRADLGDAVTGARGENCREPGRVGHPRPLTQYDAAHPYMVAMYD